MVAKRNWFLRKVWRTVRTHNMLAHGERVVVAVSGGGDSVALLMALAKLAPSLGLELVVAHLNHRLRPSADADQAFVCELAERLGLIVDTQELPRGALSDTNVEAKARSLRYAYLHDVARRFECTKVATGHTIDDQAETILLRLLRGCGLKGLRGILPVRPDGIVRPLIDCSREEARTFLRECGVPWREDESNCHPRFLRNRVRASLVPEVHALQPRFSLVAARLAAVAREEFAALEALAEEKLKALETGGGGLDLAGARQLQPWVRLTVLRAWLRQRTGKEPQPEVLKNLSRAVQTCPQPFVVVSRSGPAGYVTTQGRELLYVAGEVTGQSAESKEWDAVPLFPGHSYVLRGQWLLEVESCAQPQRQLSKLKRSEMAAVLDVDALSDSLVARPARYGDVLVPLGMTGKRKLQDVYCDRHIPGDERWGRPVVADGGTIVWVPGVVRAAHARVSSSTRQAWYLRATRLERKQAG